PAMRRVGIDAEAWIAVAKLHEFVEVVCAHGDGAGMNFVAKFEAELVRARTQATGFLDEAFPSFFYQIIIATGPKAPRIAARYFPTEGCSPEHRHNLYTQFRAEIKEPHEIILGPGLDRRR